MTLYATCLASHLHSLRCKESGKPEHPDPLTSHRSEPCHSVVGSDTLLSSSEGDGVPNSRALLFRIERRAREAARGRPQSLWLQNEARRCGGDYAHAAEWKGHS